MDKSLCEGKKPKSVFGRDKDDPEVEKIMKEIKAHWGEKWHYEDEDNFFDFKKNAETFIKRLDGLKLERVVAVTHGRILRMIVASMIFGPKLTVNEHDKIGEFLLTKNAGITICVKKDGRWQLLTWNDYSHLS